MEVAVAASMYFLESTGSLRVAGTVIINVLNNKAASIKACVYTCAAIKHQYFIARHESRPFTGITYFAGFIKRFSESGRSNPSVPPGLSASEAREKLRSSFSQSFERASLRAMNPGILM